MPGPRSATSIRTSPVAPARRDGDGLRRRVGLGRRAIFQRVVEKVRDRLPEQLAAAVKRQIVVDVHLEGHTRLLGQGLVEFRHVAHRLRRVEIGQALAGVAGFQPGDHQERVEDADEVVALLDIGFERRLQFVGRLGEPQRLVGLVAQARQGRLEIVRDIVRDLAHAVHQLADAVEHLVEVLAPDGRARRRCRPPSGGR